LLLSDTVAHRAAELSTLRRADSVRQRVTNLSIVRSLEHRALGGSDGFSCRNSFEA
jgi:hypothetical protein